MKGDSFDSGIYLSRADAAHSVYQRLIELVNRNAVYEWEILFINISSSDTTLEYLRRLRQQDKQWIEAFVRNFVRGIHAGGFWLRHRRLLRCDGCWFVAGPSELVDQMLEYWEEGYDDIYAKTAYRGEESWICVVSSLWLFMVYFSGWPYRILFCPMWAISNFWPSLCAHVASFARMRALYKRLFCWIGYQKKSIEFWSRRQADKPFLLNFLQTVGIWLSKG